MSPPLFREDELVHGADAIAPYLGRTKWAAFKALEHGTVPGARKIHGRWTLNKRVYFQSFEEEAHA